MKPAEKNYSDPWRYRCPNGHTDIRARTMNDQHGITATTKYHCGTCGWKGDELVDAKRAAAGSEVTGVTQ